MKPVAVTGIAFAILAAFFAAGYAIAGFLYDKLIGGSP